MFEDTSKRWVILTIKQYKIDQILDQEVKKYHELMRLTQNWACEWRRYLVVDIDFFLFVFIVINMWIIILDYIEYGLNKTKFQFQFVSETETNRNFSVRVRFRFDLVRSIFQNVSSGPTQFSKSRFGIGLDRYEPPKFGLGQQKTVKASCILVF
jgi:hypothetical protein